ncbi:hypothetical protein GCM10011611_10940 [Aliidongia dinghuensis]|uniref:Uncharacterized protein n=1 Tax=Aliidongia dinghuensis TaxID=1867774 RepID=A0A8J3E2C4_9PROT|nr:hypothetical protein GCM10011611_10940 [Aliidongia dinghuensis]
MGRRVRRGAAKQGRVKNGWAQMGWMKRDGATRRIAAGAVAIGAGGSLALVHGNGFPLRRRGPPNSRTDRGPPVNRGTGLSGI